MRGQEGKSGDLRSFHCGCDPGSHLGPLSLFLTHRRDCESTMGMNRSKLWTPGLAGHGESFGKLLGHEFLGS